MKSTVEKGVIGLANAGLINGGNWFVGHFGAEVLSLAFLLMDDAVNEDVKPLVLSRIEECLSQHEPFFTTEIETTDSPTTLDDLHNVVRNSISELCVDGHHTIYASLAIRAFHVFPELAKPEILDGIIALLKVCADAGFDRYYRFDKTMFDNKTFKKRFEFNTALDAAATSLALHEKVFSDQKAEGDFYFFAGSRLHLVTHAQALLDMEQLGYSDLVHAGLEGYQKHCICVESSADPLDVAPFEVTEKFDPREQAFWRRGVKNPHHGKLAYAVLSIFAAAKGTSETKALSDLSAYWEMYD